MIKKNNNFLVFLKVVGHHKFNAMLWKIKNVSRTKWVFKKCICLCFCRTKSFSGYKQDADFSNDKRPRPCMVFIRSTGASGLFTLEPAI